MKKLYERPDAEYVELEIKDSLMTIVGASDNVVDGGDADEI